MLGRRQCSTPHLAHDAGGARGQLAGLLDIRLGDILAGAWRTSSLFREQMDRSARTPGKDLFVHLAEHKVTSRHEPYIAVLQNGLEIARLPFSISVELVLKRAVVHIAGGAIQSIETDMMEGTATVKCGRTMLFQQELHSAALSGTLTVSGKAAAARLGAPVALRAS